MIIIRLDRVLADRKMRLNELAAQVGISNVNLSYLKTGRSRPSGSVPWTRSARSWAVSPGISWSMSRKRSDGVPACADGAKSAR